MKPFALALCLCASSHAVEPDKAKHAAAGFGLSYAASCAANRLGMSRPELYGIAASILVGILKELYDRRTGRGVSDRRDIIATGLGGAAGITLYRVRF